MVKKMQEYNPFDVDDGVVSKFNHDIAPYVKLWSHKMLLHINDYCEWQSVLEDYEKTGIKNNKYRKCRTEGLSSAYWLFDDRRVDIGSFNWLCQIMNVDIAVVRRKLKTEWKTISSNMKTKTSRKELFILGEDDE
jgi:hypothetical protein